jgi:hypothetical protein
MEQEVGTVWNVTVYVVVVAVNVAVSVPEAETVTVVEAEVGEVTVPTVLLHELKVSPVHAGATMV